MKQRIKKHNLFLITFTLLILLGVFSAFSLKVRAAGTGTINVNSNLASTTVTVNPGGYTGTVVTANTAVVSTTTATAGIYTASCPDNKTGYTVTDPASQTLVDGGSITFTCNYTATSVPMTFLKDLGYTTSETLVFTPSVANPNRQWSLLEGVAEISVDGKTTGDPTKAWQKSSAEVLYIGVLTVANITKTSDQHYVIGGSSATYKIDFEVAETNNPQYAATVVDTISVADPSQYGEVSIDVAGTTATSTINASDPTCLAGGITADVTTVIDDTSTPKTVTFTIPNATRNCTFELLVKLNFTADIVSNTVIHDEAVITTAETVPAKATYDTLAVGPFAQETRGGDIYSKGNLNFGQIPLSQKAAKYVIGADGNVESTSESGWTLGSYGIRSGTTDDFDPDACSVSGSACKVMNDNITRLIKGATTLNSVTTINGTFPTTLTGTPPEGWVYYKNNTGDLTIGGMGSVSFQGKGTIILNQGDLYINGNIAYNDTKSILGIIVKNGNVYIDPSVTDVSAIFYIISDQTPPNGGSRGQFIVNTNLSGDDSQFILTGAVIASGYYDSVSLKRKDAFVLARRYVGNSTALEDAAKQFALDGTPIDESLFEPSELFLFDSRIIVMPPPGFGGKIIGSM